MGDGRQLRLRATSHPLGNATFGGYTVATAEISRGGLVNKGIVVALIVLNVVVLLGQVWPEGAPPFARSVNIVFLAAALLYFANALRASK